MRHLPDFLIVLDCLAKRHQDCTCCDDYYAARVKVVTVSHPEYN